MEYFVEELQDLSISKLFKWCASVVMIFGGVAPYLPQYREIKRTENAEGFSMYVCLALLLANTLRILFWFGKRYELPLLLQSVFMNATMLVMVNLCVQTKNKKQTLKRKERVFTDFDSRYFWSWTDFQSYLDFLLLFSIVASFIMYLLLDSPVFVELVGFLAVFTEAMLGMPQLFQNYWNKSTKGMRIMEIDINHTLFHHPTVTLEYIYILKILNSPQGQENYIYALYSFPVLEESVEGLQKTLMFHLNYSTVFIKNLELNSYSNNICNTILLSVLMVLMWTAGDIFKTIYFLAREAPFQFWLCSILQVSVDLLILLQVYLFKNNDLIRKD